MASEAAQDTALRLQFNATVHLDASTFMWVSVKTFSFRGDFLDIDLLQELLAAPAYRDDYLSPEHPTRATTVPPVHAKWWLDRIGSHQFEPTEPAAGIAELLFWANEQDWAGGYHGQSVEATSRLRNQVFQLLRSGRVYRLKAPEDDAAIHSYGESLGTTGFLEFVVIDRDNQVVHLIVASDD